MRVQAVLRVWPRPVTLVHGELAVALGLRRFSNVQPRHPVHGSPSFELLRVPARRRRAGRHHGRYLQKVWCRRGKDDIDRELEPSKKLRTRLGDNAADPTHIFNEHGIGYHIASPGPVAFGGPPLRSRRPRPV